MKLYITAAGAYARTKDEAGKCHTAVEVPTDARGLVAYLNSIRETTERLPAPSFAGMKIVEDPELRPGQIVVLPAGVKPSDLRSPIRPTPSGAFRLRQGDEASQISDWVLDAPGAGVVTVLGACVERIERMGKAATASSAPVSVCDGAGTNW